ncbi:MAG: substrate-binding and VWA domain-containing protein [Micromonosporaceae bacterium]
MSGRHRSFALPRFLELPKGSAGPVALVAAIVVLAVVAWSAYSFFVQQLQGDACDSPATIDIAAAPEIAPALTDIASAGITSGEDETGCWVVRVTSAESEQTAVSLARPSKGNVATDARPDVWVADSTFWLRHTRANGAFDVPEKGVSIASSPVVLAMVEPSARQLGWPQPLDWPTVLGTEDVTSPIRSGIADPGHSPVGLSGLIAIDKAMAGTSKPGPNRVAALRQMSKNVSVVAPDLFGKLPQNDDPTSLATALGAFPATEQSLLAYNSRQPIVPLVPLYADDPGPSMDYPYVVMPKTAKPVREAAERFLETVLSKQSRKPLLSRGFRTPGGEVGPGFPNTRGARQSTVEPVVLPDSDSVEELLTVWTGINRSGRILTVIDVSGSMNNVVPGTNQKLIEMTRVAIIQGIGLFRETTEVGAWIFASDLAGGRPYQELVPIGPLYANKARLINAASTVQAVEGGSTALYDTTLAAYKAAKQGWDPARINVVLVIADGENNAGNLSRAQLLAELKKLQDPRKPLPIINVGLGPAVNKGELDAISHATGGKAYVARDPTKMQEVFLAALADLTCVPPHCDKA